MVQNRVTVYILRHYSEPSWVHSNDSSPGLTTKEDEAFVFSSWAKAEECRSRLSNGAYWAIVPHQPDHRRPLLVLIFLPLPWRIVCAVVLAILTTAGAVISSGATPIRDWATLICGITHLTT